MKRIDVSPEPHSQHGFTLIELSIVLVIIGLIIGGILVGQDLIKAAEVRATVSQIQKYDSAVNTFRGKYGYVPGDLNSAQATNLGFFAETTLGGTVGHQDGNGLLEGGSAGATVGLGETLGFWRHLTEASLMDGNYGTASAGNALVVTTGAVTTALTAGTVSQVFPPAKLGRGNYVTLYSANGQNYFEIAGITAMTTAGVYTLNGAITPQEASTIDQKIDDGLPLSGTVQALYDTANLNTAAVAGAATCVFTGGAQYNTTTTALANTPLCQLGIRFN